MFSNGRLWWILAVMILPAIIAGCGEGGSSGTLEPLADEPMVLESVLCLSIDEGRPAGITDSFLSSDDEIYIWLYWTNIEHTYTIDAIWFEPGGDYAYMEESQTISSSTGFKITWFVLNKPSGGFARGNWSVDIYVDDMFERSHLFAVE